LSPFNISKWSVGRDAETGALQATLKIATHCRPAACARAAIAVVAAFFAAAEAARMTAESELGA
jgi:hypothetical protein